MQSYSRSFKKIKEPGKMPPSGGRKDEINVRRTETKGI